MSREIVPVILAGGKGRRLRPLTSSRRPKPFLKIFSRRSFFQDALVRVENFSPPVIVANEDYKNHIRRQCAEINSIPQAIILEPEGRNTAASVMAAAHVLRNRDCLMLVMPSDHVFGDGVQFQKTIKDLAAGLRLDGIGLIGIRPQGPSARYGYIHTDGQSAAVRSVQSFMEKPDKATARKLYGNNHVFWNAGIILCPPDAIMKAGKTASPEVADNIAKSMDDAEIQEKCIYLPQRSHFVKTPSISIDYAVLERCDVLQLCAYIGEWSDIGTWLALLGLAIKRLRQKI